MEEMDTPTRRTLHRYYRMKHFPHISAAFAAGGVLLTIFPDALTFGMDILKLPLRVILGTTAFMNASLALTAIYLRIIYRRNPYCAACGLDEVDCKINRNSISRHEPEPCRQIAP